MYRRFDAHRGPRHDNGKWKRLARSGVGHVVSETDGQWEVEVTMRRVGTSIRRDVYSVSIRSESPRHEEFLNGFTSQQSALQSAHERIALLQAVQKMRVKR